ncbi:MAG TPA: hypothetical protein PL151_12070 [Phycisphaerae bacterium]|nr:hypothetical protein [Phycisphaerae bacterium]HOJ73522.1 hypothetical protein [Phycisphaerae bacterium]HOM51670.1 hypothetical protein [Phycisphaerae bacterium]HON65934.1 hypothetical protein [Phycisphaerae bacterium]HPP25642.1 hypothetical protein [Phycisphaerae bacterium]
MNDVPQPDVFPAQWLKSLEALPRQLTVNVAGYSIAVSVTRDDLTTAYLPVLHLLTAALGDRRRVVAGLAGIPGSGKSTFTAVLAVLADTLLGMGRLVAVGMDGWHWPNAVLDVRTTTDEAGRTIPLRQRKGGPESFDVNAIAAAVRELHDPSRVVSLPVYDRRLHDPVPDGVHVGPGTAIVLLEGNFLLETASPWDQVSSQLQPKLFLEHDPADARQRVIARHVRGGLSPDEAARKFELNDRLNTDVVLATAGNADYVVRFPRTR